MFDKRNGSPVAVRDKPGHEMTLASCGPGTRCAAVVDGEILVLSALGPGFTCGRLVLPLPPGGQVIALDAGGPSALTADGTLWTWGLLNEQWQAVGCLRRDA